MKVLFVHGLYAPNAIGGGEATIKLLAEGLLRTGDQAVVVSLDPGGLRQQRSINGVHVYYVPLFNVHFPYPPQSQSAALKPLFRLIDAYNPVMARRVLEIIDLESPDVVNLHNIQGFSAALWPALARRNIPLVQTLHDHYSVCVNSTMYRRGKNCLTPCLDCRVLCSPRVRLSRKVDVLTVVSRRLRDRITGFGAYAGVEDVRVIPGSNKDPPSAYEGLASGPTGRELTLGFLGRLEPIKGLELLLQAVQTIACDRIRVKIGGTGTPEYEAALKARFAFPRLKFLGRVDPADFLTAIDALVVPSVVEDSLPRVVHEAFGFGVPVIGARIGGIPEMVQDERTGYLFEPNSADALETVIRRLLIAPPDWPALKAACIAAAGRYSSERVFGAYRAAWIAAMTRKSQERSLRALSVTR